MSRGGLRAGLGNKHLRAWSGGRDPSPCHLSSALVRLPRAYTISSPPLQHQVRTSFQKDTRSRLTILYNHSISYLPRFEWPLFFVLYCEGLVTSTLSSHRSRPAFDMLTSGHAVDNRRAHSIWRRWRGVPRVPSSPLSCRVPVSPSESLRVPVLPIADFAYEQ
jgi:hypothetical protein